MTNWKGWERKLRNWEWPQNSSRYSASHINTNHRTPNTNPESLTFESDCRTESCWQADSRLDTQIILWLLYSLDQCFSTAGPRPGTGPWHQLYRAARNILLKFAILVFWAIFMNKCFIVEIFWGEKYFVKCVEKLRPRCWPEETTIYYKISLVEWLITNLNVILYLSTCHTVYKSVLTLFMIMP